MSAPTGAERLDDKQLRDRLCKVAALVRAPANKYAEAQNVRDVLRIIEGVSVEEYASLRASLYGPVVAPDIEMAPLTERLWNFHQRLESEGQYTNANIVWLAWKELHSRRQA